MTPILRAVLVPALWLTAICSSGASRQLCAADPAPLEMPRVLRPDLRLELFCREPEIVTPVAIDVDAKGRVWAIESNTHFPKPDYTRHPSDRILVIADRDGDGKADSFQVFRDGLRHTMALALRGPGKLFVATRRSVHLFEDTDGDDHADRETLLARLDTVEQYPHNGLSGFAFDADGWLFFGIGENMAVPYTLTAADGSRVSGGPEGGSIFRMRPEGARLERWALGFWNPFHLAFDGDARLYAVDNDPDSRPPCRLIHVVRGGDYGYRRWLGRKGLHPFTAWNGELPGTLPMAAGTGEAPSGVLWAARTRLPEDLRETLVVTSWGDHRIESYRMQLRGASVRSVAVPIVQGGEMFRPVGIAAAPDGSVYFSDWVDQDYQVHSKGRIWRLRGKDGEAAAVAASGGSTTASPAGAAASKNPAGESERAAAACVARRVKLEAFLEGAARDPSGAERAAEEIRTLAGNDGDPFIECAAINALARACGAAWLLDHRSDSDPRMRLRVLLALRRTEDPASRAAVDDFLRDPDLAVRRAAMQWVGEERLKDHRGQLEKSLDIASASGAILDAWLAAMSLLTNEAPDARDAVAADDFLLALARGKTQGDSVRAFALRSISPGHAALDDATLAGFLREQDAQLRLEAVRTLRLRSSRDARALIEGLAGNRNEPESLRREAIAGLAAGVAEAGSGNDLLRELTRAPEAGIRDEAQRALRFVGAAAAGTEGAGAASRPAGSPGLDAATAAKALSGGDATRGERLFFHPAGPRCSNCHSARGRGGRAGPDLSNAGQTARAKLLESIVDPAKEVAPQYTSWTFITRNGVRTGTLLGEDPDGTVAIADASGAASRLAPGEILGREMAKGSLMPEGVATLLELDELRDLLAYLETLR